MLNINEKKKKCSCGYTAFLSFQSRLFFRYEEAGRQITVQNPQNLKFDCALKEIANKCQILFLKCRTLFMGQKLGGPQKRLERKL